MDVRGSAFNAGNQPGIRPPPMALFPLGYKSSVFLLGACLNLLSGVYSAFYCLSLAVAHCIVVFAPVFSFSLALEKAYNRRLPYVSVLRARSRMKRA